MIKDFKLKKPSKATLFHWALDSLYYSQLYRFFEPNFSGIGAIFTLHQVVPPVKSQNLFAPNRILEVTTDFLDQTIQQVRELDYDIVSLDEAHRRLVEKDFKRKFVCFTLDDGYIDNYEFAFPIFKKHNAEFAIYITTEMPDGKAWLWWRALEEVLLREDHVELILDKKSLCLSTISNEEKYKAYYQIYWGLRSLCTADQYTTAQKIFDDYGVDTQKLCRKFAITWDKLAELSQSGLVTIGAHTVSHRPLSKLTLEKARIEAHSSREIIANQLNIDTKHFCYPYGDQASATTREFNLIKELNFVTATTTRKGVLFPEHATHLHALPRISLNGDYQKQRYIKLFLTGGPFTLSRCFRLIDVD